MMKRNFLSLVSMVFIAAMTLTSCDEFKSFMDNPVNSYLEVDTALYVKEGATIDLYAETISDAAVTYTVGDEKIAKVEKVDNKHAKVTGVKPGMTVVKVQVAANDAYAGGEATVKVNVTPAYTLADAVKDGEKLLIGYKFNGEDCLFAYEFDASHKVFNQLAEDSDVPAALDDYTVTITYDEQMGKIAHKVTYNGNDATMIVVPFELNLYTAGSFDRIFRVPVVMTSLKVHGYELLPFTPESVIPVESILPSQLPDDISVGEQGIFKVDFLPVNATNQVIKYSSNNTEAMTIDEKGVFKAIAAGEATIKAVSADNPAKFAEHKFTVAEGGTYLAWDADQKKLIEVNFPATVTKVQNSSTNVNWQGTYVVEGEVTIGGQIQLTGDVDLIIKDGAKLTVNSYIYGSKNLRIYGQANQTGQLVVNCSNNDAIYNMTTLEVHSCQVTATSSADACGGFFFIQTFNVYGGSVDAKGTSTLGYGIGLKGGGSMNIYGGEVKAEGKGSDNFYSRGILCEDSFNKATVTVYGGKLWAGCADKKAFNNVNLQKDAGFTGKTETSDNGTSWTEYTQADTPGTKYVRVGY